MIELAPHHKVGLPMPNPVMTAAGCFGYGPEYADWADASRLGAIVTNPVSLRPRRGPAQPRVVETPGGFILNTGDQNPGVRRVLQRYAAGWKRLGRPVVVHLAPDDLEALARTARALEAVDAVAGLELGLPEDASHADAASLVAAARESELPLLARLPLAHAADLAAVCVEAGADALVVGAPPLGSALHPSGSGQVVTGRLYGPALHALAMHALLKVRPLVDVPLVGCGGIHSVEDARALLDAGAVAVQVDSAIFTAPSLLGRLAEALG
jgi:dihydroorotate dehydrogenase (NAD+) catalytic subunit